MTERRRTTHTLTNCRVNQRLVKRESGRHQVDVNLRRGQRTHFAMSRRETSKMLKAQFLTGGHRFFLFIT
jgi:hypothetical protein